MLTIQEIQDFVISSVCEVQQLSGRSIPANLDANLRPIGGCAGFDSLNGVEVAVQVSVILGCEVKGNPFADGYTALTVEAISKRLYKLQVDGANNGKR